MFFRQFKFGEAILGQRGFEAGKLDVQVAWKKENDEPQYIVVLPLHPAPGDPARLAPTEDFERLKQGIRYLEMVGADMDSYQHFLRAIEWPAGASHIAVLLLCESTDDNLFNQRERLPLPPGFGKAAGDPDPKVTWVAKRLPRDEGAILEALRQFLAGRQLHDGDRFIVQAPLPTAAPKGPGP